MGASRQKLVIALVTAGALGTLGPATTWAASRAATRLSAPLTRAIYMRAAGAEMHCADLAGMCGLGVR